MTQRIYPMIAYEDTAAAIDWLAPAEVLEGNRWMFQQL